MHSGTTSAFIVIIWFLGTTTVFIGIDVSIHAPREGSDLALSSFEIFVIEKEI
jgi:hypothetical protein